MATVLTTISPVPTYRAFEGMDPAAPIGEYQFSARNINIPQPGAGNKNLVLFDCELPKGNGYVVEDLSISLASTSDTLGVNYGSIAPGLLSDAESATDRTYDIPFTLQSLGTGFRGGTPVQVRTWQFQSELAKPSLMVAAFRDVGVLRVWCFDNNTNGNEANCDAFARILVYPYRAAFQQAPNANISTR